MLLDWSAHPVDLGISGDGGMVDVDHDDLIVLVGGVLAHPVGVQDPQALESSAHSFLSNGLKVSLRLLLLDSTRSLGLTIGTSLGNRTLAATTPHGDTVDDESLLGLVSQPASFVWPGWARGTVDLRQKMFKCCKIISYLKSKLINVENTSGMHHGKIIEDLLV